MAAAEMFKVFEMHGIHNTERKSKEDTRKIVQHLEDAIRNIIQIDPEKEVNFQTLFYLLQNPPKEKKTSMTNNCFLLADYLGRQTSMLLSRLADRLLSCYCRNYGLRNKGHVCLPPL